MTQTLDALDVDARSSPRDGSRSMGAPRSATQAGESRLGTFAIAFGIAFALLYTVFERLNWPLFTYLPVGNKLYFWIYRPVPGEGPPMYWYGWIVLSAASALVVGWIATVIPGQWLRRATLFCCVLAVLWPTSLAALRSFITDWATFDADFLDSVWVAAIPALAGTAAITYFVSSQFVQRVWLNLLWIMPIGGLAVLGYSLKQYFVH
jgi:hypothetical protein